MTFVQVIEYETSHADCVDQLMDEWLKNTEGKRTAYHASLGRDRDKPLHCTQIVEFPSYEQAMRNSDLPETRHIAEELQKACEGEPRLVNLDIARDEKI
jgi:hypothetical protein